MHVGIAKPWWRGKCPRHSRHMRNPQFCVSGKRPMGHVVWHHSWGYYSGTSSSSRVSATHLNLWKPVLSRFSIELWWLDPTLGPRVVVPGMANRITFPILSFVQNIVPRWRKCKQSPSLINIGTFIIHFSKVIRLSPKMRWKTPSAMNVHICHIFPEAPFHYHWLPKFRVWISNYGHCFLWGVITHTCP